MELQTEKIAFWPHTCSLQLDLLIRDQASPRTHKPKTVNNSLNSVDPDQTAPIGAF